MPEQQGPPSAVNVGRNLSSHRNLAPAIVSQVEIRAICSLGIRGEEMAEGSHGDLLVAAATILGAILGVAGAYLVEYFRKERRAVRFTLNSPEDLARALRERGNSFEVKVNDFSTQELIAAGVTVKNTGNTIVNNLAFDLVVPGPHRLALAEITTDNVKLKSAISIDFDNILPPQDPLFKISAAFFNPGETFKITTFSDGPENRCTVACRLPEVKIKTITEEDVKRKMATFEEAATTLGKVAGLGTAATIAAAATALLSIFSH
jgi:hypothetical protein